MAEKSKDEYVGNYPKTPYHNDNYERRLSRMNRQDRLLAKAIKRTTLAPKNKYNRKDQIEYDIGNGQRVGHLPKEWR